MMLIYLAQMIDVLNLNLLHGVTVGGYPAENTYWARSRFFTIVFMVKLKLYHLLKFHSTDTL